MRFDRASLPRLVAGLLVAGLAFVRPGHAQMLGPAPLPTGGFATGTPPAAAPNPDPAAPAVAPKPKPKVIAAPVVHERVVARNDKRPSFHADSLAAINEAAQKYLAIANAGGWPILPASVVLKPGSEGDYVLMLRQRLAAEGDLPSTDVTNPLFDAPLAAAIKRFQGRHGQSQNALVQGPTLAALRVSARERFTQLNESARRLALRNFSFGSRYVVVNIPSASVEAIENGIVEKRFIAVVGKKDRASPEVETRITNINLNPTWTVPVSIIKKDIIPKMQKDPAYLQKAKIRIYGASGNEVDPHAIDWKTERAVAFTLRQDSGTANALGQLRIDMPNRDAVYMHDTPSKRLFGTDNRFHSSGCVRVENVRDLAVWILEGQKGWDRAAIDAAIAEGKRKDVRPKEPIPVVWTYLTGYVTPDGAVHFRPDVYGLDSGPVLTASGDPATPRKAKAAPLALDAAGLDARISASSQEAPTRQAPVQRIDP
jgi:L,D-transpeptidase YcbB